MKRKFQTIKITSAKYVDGNRLKLVFSDGKEQLVDFGPFLRNSLHADIRKFLIPKNFKKFILKDGDLMWGDFDLIFPIMDLYRTA